MVKMIKLEWEKNNIKKYIRNAVIMSGVIIILLLFAAIGEMRTECKIDVYNKRILYVGIESLANMSYIVFASVMMVSFIIKEYNSKTVYIMFSYPIKRQKILLAQMLSVWIFNVVALIITKLLAYGIFCFASGFIDIDMRGIKFGAFSFYIQIITSSIMMISLCFIALVIGVKMKSSEATVVSSAILACLTQTNVVSYMMEDNISFCIIAFVLSIVSAIFTIYNVDKTDI